MYIAPEKIINRTTVTRDIRLSFSLPLRFNPLISPPSVQSYFMFLHCDIPVQIPSPFYLRSQFVTLSHKKDQHHSFFHGANPMGRFFFGSNGIMSSRMVLNMSLSWLSYFFSSADSSLWVPINSRR